MQRYHVDVQRVSYSNFVQVTVEAPSPEAAVQLALQQAGNIEFVEDSFDYEVDTILEAK